MNNQRKERSLLFESFRGNVRISTPPKKYPKTFGKTSPSHAGKNEPLKKAPFGFLADCGLENILPFLEVRHVQKGEVIWRQGDPCNFMIFVDRGKIKITKRSEFEMNQVVIGMVGKESLAGDCSMLENNFFPTTATAMEHCLLGLLNKEKFQEILEKSPAIGIQLLKEMLSCTSSQLRQSMSRLIHLF
jgi:CRP/FNR family transcriptional regulator, cyclic AMP receptor protein